jgi:hypothetical protein
MLREESGGEIKFDDEQSEYTYGALRFQVDSMSIPCRGSERSPVNMSAIDGLPWSGKNAVPNGNDWRMATKDFGWTV